MCFCDKNRGHQNIYTKFLMQYTHLELKWVEIQVCIHILMSSVQVCIDNLMFLSQKHVPYFSMSFFLFG